MPKAKVVGQGPSLDTIKEVYVWVAVDAKTGKEGICGVPTALGWMPAFGCDPKTLRVLKAKLLEVLKGSKTKAHLYLVRFSDRSVIEQHFCEGWTDGEDVKAT